MKFNSRAGTILRITVTGLLIFVLFKRVDVDALGASFNGLNWAWLAAAYAMMWCVILTHNFNWQWLLRSEGTRVAFRSLLSCYLSGYFMGHFLPKLLGADTARALTATRLGISKTRSLTIAMFNRMISMTVMFMLLVFFIFSSPQAFSGLHLSGSAVLLLAAGLITCVTGAFMFATSGLAAKWTSKSWYPIVHALEILRHYRKRWPIVLVSFVIALAQQTFVLIRYYFAAKALGIELDFATMSVVVALVIALTTIPVTINGIGIRENGFVYFLGIVGISAERALAVSLVNYSLMLFMASLGSIVFLLSRGKTQKDQQPAAHLEREMAPA